MNAGLLSEGLVLHYDIMRASTRGYEHYSNDPAMQAVTGARVPLTVVSVLPTRERLFEQFLARAREGDYEEWWDKRETMRRLRRRFRERFLKLIGKQPRLLRESHLRLLAVYASDRSLAEWTSRWQGFLRDVARERRDVRLIFVAPKPAQDGRPRFRLLSRSELSRGVAR